MSMMLHHRKVVASLSQAVAWLVLVSVPVSAQAQSAQPLNLSGLNSPSTTVSPSVPAPLPAPSIGRQWRGFYVGGFIGAAQGDSDVATTTVFTTTGYFASSSPPAIIAAGDQTLDTSDTEFGGLAGYNIQIGRAVFGGEGDYSSMRLSGTVTSGDTYPCCAPTAFVIQQSVDTKWLATLRFRGGVTFGRTFVYGTFGMAWTDLNYQAVFTDNFANAHENGGLDNLQSSTVWGAGVEFWLIRNFSVKGEYLNTKFEPATTTSTNLTAGGTAYPNNVFTHSSNLAVQVFRGGVIFRF
jgi:outer membrane immunogenic protein